MSSEISRAASSEIDSIPTADLPLLPHQVADSSLLDPLCPNEEGILEDTDEWSNDESDGWESASDVEQDVNDEVANLVSECMRRRTPNSKGN